MGATEELQISVDGAEVLVIRSARRTRTVTADQIAGQLRLRVPMRLSRREIEKHARAFQARLASREATAGRSNEALLQRAEELSQKFFGGAAHPSAVTWSARQQRRWGSTTSTTAEIRLSARLRSMPEWVVDAVLIHELAHLIEPSHNSTFKKLVARYPRTAEADAFLAGVSWADSQSQT